MSEPQKGNAPSRFDELVRDLATAKRDLAARDVTIEQLQAEVATLRAAAEAPAPAGTKALVLKMALQHNGVTFPAGAELPFDPASPPPGCDGLVAGVHYHELHVLRAPLASR